MNNWFSTLKNSLSKTSVSFSTGLRKIFISNKPTKEIIDDIEEILIFNDLGVSFTEKIIQRLSKKSFNTSISKNIVINYIASELELILKPYEKKFIINQTNNLPYVILFSGTNGSGKTTSLAKIASKLHRDGKKVLIAAGDSFRAAAAEQLETWTKRCKCPIVMGSYNSDPASIVYKSLTKARNENFDVLLIDTAGRMHNRLDLMNELRKINSILKKTDSLLPQLSLLVVDSTIGQIAIKQAESFKKIIDINGLIITKLDGTSKAGVLLPITERCKLPIYLIGVGEELDDLKEFSVREFIDSLLCPTK